MKGISIITAAPGFTQQLIHQLRASVKTLLRFSQENKVRVSISVVVFKLVL